MAQKARTESEWGKECICVGISLYTAYSDLNGSQNPDMLNASIGPPLRGSARDGFDRGRTDFSFREIPWIHARKCRHEDHEADG